MNSSEQVGTIKALWRYPVKSMLGEELNTVDLSKGGIVGDRAYALRDRETGKIASAKHPKLWPNLLACRAAFVDDPHPDDELQPVRIELADGNVVLSEASDVDAVLSRALAQHNRIDVAGALYRCAGVYAVAEATGAIHRDDRVSLV